MKTIEAVLSALAMLALVVALGLAMAITLERGQSVAITVPPAEKNPPIRPEVQRLIDELRRLTEAPAFYRIPWAGDRVNQKVLM